MSLVSPLGLYSGWSTTLPPSVVTASTVASRTISVVLMLPVGTETDCIAPGLITTEFSRVLYEDPERRAKREEETPLRRLGAPEDIAGAALLLASPAGAFITGQTIVVDGGVMIASL